jgi:hypothetical protein
MEPESILLCSRGPATDSCHEPQKSSPHFHHHHHHRRRRRHNHQGLHLSVRSVPQ